MPAILSLVIATLLLSLTHVSATLAEEKPSPYAGQQARQVKALSKAEIEGLLAGRGLGYAKAAELNHYPGPRHVLDLAGPWSEGYLLAAERNPDTGVLEAGCDPRAEKSEVFPSFALSW